MLSPATLLVLERLIRILMILVRALDEAAAQAHGPSFRRAAARLVFSRLAACLERLRDANAQPEPTPAASLASPPTPPLVTDLIPPALHITALTSISNTTRDPLVARAPAATRPPRSKPRPAPPLWHAHFVAKS